MLATHFEDLRFNGTQKVGRGEEAVGNQLVLDLIRRVPHGLHRFRDVDLSRPGTAYSLHVEGSGLLNDELLAAGDLDLDQQIIVDERTTVGSQGD